MVVVIMVAVVEGYRINAVVGGQVDSGCTSNRNSSWQ